jgi:hypothetical protein
MEGFEPPSRHRLLPCQPTMSSKTPLPRMSLCAREKDSKRHPGKPDMPRSKRSTTEVQAEKTEKAREQSKREHLRIETIQSTTELETRMEAQLKEKLVTAHHPPPTAQKKVSRVHAKTLSEVVSTGMNFSLTLTRTIVKSQCTQTTEVTELEPHRQRRRRQQV